MNIRIGGPVAGLAAIALLGLSPLASAASISGTYHEGAQGPTVKLMQVALEKAGYNVPATGYFGSETEAAVKQLQAKHHLAVDGIAGPATDAILNAALRSTKTANTASDQYRVKTGDTLSSIAARFHTTWTQLAALNHLKNPGSLRVGEVLLIPLTAQAPAHSGNSASLPLESAPASLNNAIVTTALQYLGVPYVWGGSSPAGFDCSGLVQYVLAQNGISIGRTTWDQYDEVTKVSRAALSPGDLVFFSTDAAGASHVGIYIGSYPSLGYQEAFVDAPAPGQSVMVQNLSNVYWVAHYYGAGQVKP